MSIALLCVQFRNLLPSEELLLSARALWQEAQQRAGRAADGDATLSITLRSSNLEHFEVALTLPGSTRSVRAKDAQPLAAIRRVFDQIDQLDRSAGHDQRPTLVPVRKTAPSPRSRSLGDTGGGS